MSDKMVYDEIIEAASRGEEYMPELAAESDADAIARQVIDVCLQELLPPILSMNDQREKVAACCFAHWKLNRVEL